MADPNDYFDGPPMEDVLLVLLLIAGLSLGITQAVLSML